MNNIGGPVKDKLSFVRNYKFTIAFENSAVPGYTTEKLIEPIIANSLPIYYGNPLVYLDFEPGSFVYLDSEDDIVRVIEEVIELDNDNDKYLAILNSEKFKQYNTIEKWEEGLVSFFKNIFMKPMSSAFRRPVHGFASFYVGELKLQTKLLDRKKRHNRVKSTIKKELFKVLQK